VKRFSAEKFVCIRNATGSFFIEEYSCKFLTVRFESDPILIQLLRSSKVRMRYNE
jgi:hypothetical protein